MGEPGTAARRLVEQIGKSVDAEEAREVYRTRFGGHTVVLRRDCHGALRRLEIDVTGRSPAIKARLSTLGQWLEPIPATLHVLDAQGVGRFVLTSERLATTLRVNLKRSRLVELLELCHAALQPGSPEVSP